MAKYAKLEDEAPASWPDMNKLADIMEEQDDGLIKALGGIEGLVERLGSHATNGLSGSADDLAQRVRVYGGNSFAEKRLKGYLELVWDGLHDAVIILLLAMSAISFVAEMCFGAHPETGWIESAAICVSVAIIVNVAASTDYFKERMFAELTQQLASSNRKVVVRGGVQREVEDREIVVGDVLAFNAHSLASIPCDGLLLQATNVKMDESALTGEPEPVPRSAESPYIVSGTQAVAGAGRMLVVAVGAHSVSGKIRAAVYGESDEEGDEGSPLFRKLDLLVLQIGKVGGAAALLCLAAMSIIGFGYEAQPPIKLLEYVITAITVLAVAVPEGLPLAVTLSLAFSSHRMMRQNNLVKHLDACETMGSATTICSDKTGTLTCNRMTVRGAAIGGGLLLPAEAVPGGEGAIGGRLRAGASAGLTDLLATLLAVCTMDESYLEPPSERGGRPIFKGNPTECALLQLVQEMGFDYREIREATTGRGAASLAKGRPLPFTSGRKLMSWAVPTPGGGWRMFVKGASEIVMQRCAEAVDGEGVLRPLDGEAAAAAAGHIARFATSGMRTLGLAYSDFAAGAEPDWEAAHADLTNADGSRALACESGLVWLGVVGIEDPLRPEVPAAIAKCHAAGIDVRMVTGDAIATAVAIAASCGILAEVDLEPEADADGRRQPKRFRAMEGKDFRGRVYRKDAATGEPTFDQQEFDVIWPYLRVLARASPDDKLTLATGLRRSLLFADTERVAALQAEGIYVYPDRQVVAMTGDGTNDAPALKKADVGFAMGISGTQVAKDACNIVLLDDNFASIVTAVKWGRNVYESISKFLQFQLTVNVVAITLAIVGAFVYQESPIAAVQMLWVNLIMDSLASLALATEPPTEALLQRLPVQRSASLVTQQMLCNMTGHALLQVGVCGWLLFYGAAYFGLEEGHAHMQQHAGAPSEHYTLLFNCFVMMTLANEVNCRKLHGEANVFVGILDNPWFVGILVTTLVLQCAVVQFGGRAVQCHPLSADEWLFCLACGAATLPWQQLINVVARLVKSVDSTRDSRGSHESGLLKFKSPYGNGMVKLNRTSKSDDARSQQRVQHGQRVYRSKSASGEAPAKAEV